MPISLSRYHGYPEFVSDGVHEKVANASCVGETSTSFLMAGAPDLGCAMWKAAHEPMWVPYAPNETQIEYAISYLKNNPNPKLVTINIGGNDLGLLQYTCMNVLSCELAGLPGVLGAYQQNLVAIFQGLRENASYKGPIVLLTYYVFDYSAAGLASPETQAFVALNNIATAVATSFGAQVADGFGAFQAASGHSGDPCKAGLLVPATPQTNPPSCGVHPSIAGQQVLADAILKVVGGSDKGHDNGHGH